MYKFIAQKPITAEKFAEMLDKSFKGIYHGYWMGVDFIPTKHAVCFADEITATTPNGQGAVS